MLVVLVGPWHVCYQKCVYQGPFFYRHVLTACFVCPMLSLLQESCHFPARQRRMLLEQLNKALKATTIKVALAAAEEEGMAAQGPQA